MKKIFLSFMALALLVAPKTFAQSKLATICSGGKGDDKIEVVYHNLLGIEVQKHSTFYKFEQRNISYTENEIIATLDKMNQNSDGQTYTDTNVRLEMKFIESTRSNAVYLLIEELTMNGQKKSPKDVRILKCE